jgi:L-asparagine oxygenase
MSIRTEVESENGSLGGRLAPVSPAAPKASRGQDPLLVVELSEHERAAAAEALESGFLAAVEQAEIAPESEDFFDAAEIVEGALPQDARAALVALRRRALHAVVIRGLPSDADPGPTPTHNGELPAPPRRGNAWLAMAVRRLGDEFAYQMEKKGSTVHNIHPTHEGAKTQSNASFTVDLSLHTENAFHPLRPDYVCLYCVRSVADAPGTRLVMLDDILARLTDEEIAVLREPRFTIRVVDSHKAEGEADIELPVTPLTGSPRRPQIRWHETLRANDNIAAKVAGAFADAARDATRHVSLHQGDLLAFANHTCLHGRDAFDAQLDGTDRWLIRGYALRDRTRTEPFVAPARPRVTRVDLAAVAAS